MFKDLWDEQVKLSGEKTKTHESELRAVEQKVDQLVDLILEANSSTTVKSYESKLRKLEERKVILKERVQNCGRPLRDFDETYRTAMQFLANPYKLWTSEHLEDKRTVLKLVFSKKLEYSRNKGYRTAALSLPFCLIGQLKGSNYELVELGGIEPPTS